MLHKTYKPLKYLNKLTKLLLSFGLIFVLSACSSAKTCHISPQVKRITSEYRGLDFKRPLKCSALSQDEIKEDLRSALSTRNEIADLKNEEIVYKLLGIIPEEFNYIQGLKQAYGSEVLGYYDYIKKRFVVGKKSESKTEKHVLVHELTHALQDQHYNVDNLLKPGTESDKILAIRALLEADALRTVELYRQNFDCSRHNEKTALIESRHLVLVPELAHIPRALRMLIDFPYSHGKAFLCEALRLGKLDSVNQLFDNPPLTTREIIHPSKYIARLSNPATENKPALFQVKEGFLASEALGEYSFFSMLAVFMDFRTAHEASSGLETDRYWLYAKGDKKELVWVSRWESIEDLKQAKQALAHQFVARFPKTNQAISKSRRKLSSKGYELELDESGKKLLVTYRRIN